MSATRREMLQYFSTLTATGLMGPGCIGWMREDAVKVDSWHKSVCRFCGTGCETRVGLRDGKVVKVEGLQEGWNQGRLCIKGLLNREILYVSDRAQYPMIRSQGRLVRATWDEALDAAAEGFKQAIAQGGPDAVAYYGSGQLFTQESYTANKLFKAGIGTNNVDGNPRLCMASPAFAYKSVFGSDEPSGTYDDIAHATLFFVIGANMAECHPVVWSMVQDRLRSNSKARLIVVDPRRTPTARGATMHLQLKPGTDVALLNAMAHEMIKNGHVDRAFINGHVTFRRGAPDSAELPFEELVKFLEDYTPEKVANVCGLSATEIREAARHFGTTQAAMSFWTMGLNQQVHGVASNRMVMALHLLTGQFGRPGATPFSLTGQPNAGGGVRDTGSLSHALPAGRAIAKEKDRHTMEKLWKVPEGRISPTPGLSAVPLFEAMHEGKVRAALVMATNPARSLPNADRYREAMKRAFLVVADSIFPTDTGELADVFLPAAMWTEKEGVFSQSERRYHLIQKLVEPPGEARSDLDILLAFGDRLGFAELLSARTPEAVWDEWRGVAAGTAYEFSGITYARLKELPGLRWPCPTPDHPGTNRRYVPGEDPLAKKEGRIDFYARPDKRAVVFLSEQNGTREPVSAEYPMTLTTGRRLEHWHTSTITGRIPQLRDVPTDYLEIHPTDAAALNAEEGTPLRITSARGSMKLRARPSLNVRPGLVFAPFHSLEHLVNAATNDAIDPISAQPEYKMAAVRVERAEALVGVDQP